MKQYLPGPLLPCDAILWPGVGTKGVRNCKQRSLSCFHHSLSTCLNKNCPEFLKIMLTYVKLLTYNHVLIFIVFTLTVGVLKHS